MPPVGPTIVAGAEGGQGEAVQLALALRRLVAVVNADLPCLTEDDVRACSPPCRRAGSRSHGERRHDECARTRGPRALRAALRRRQRGGFRAHAGQLGVGRRSPSPNLADDVDTIDDLERLATRLGPRTALRSQRLLHPPL